MLRTIAIVVVVLVAGVLIYAALQPDTFQIERTTSVKAAPEKIFPLIDHLPTNAKWLPYYMKDPAMKFAYSGPEHGPGAAVNFDGNKDVGTGRVTITDSDAPARVTMRLEMFKPMAADNTVEFTLRPNGGATDVTWAMRGKQPFLGRLVCLFFNMDKMVGRDFEAGLANLKALAEAGPRS